MPRQRIPLWQPLTPESQSWQCLTPSVRASYLVRKLRAKHDLKIVSQFGQDRFIHSPDLSSYCVWEQSLLNPESLWIVQTKFFTFCQWLKDTHPDQADQLVRAEQETFIQVLRAIDQDKELSRHLFESGLSSQTVVRKNTLCLKL